MLPPFRSGSPAWGFPLATWVISAAYPASQVILSAQRLVPLMMIAPSFEPIQGLMSCTAPAWKKMESVSAGKSPPCRAPDGRRDSKPACLRSERASRLATPTVYKFETFTTTEDVMVKKSILL